MNVKRLMEQLSKMDPNDEVVFYDHSQPTTVDEVVSGRLAEDFGEVYLGEEDDEEEGFDDTLPCAVLVTHM